MNYVTVDSILASLNRQIKDSFNEHDIIEWIGEALSFMPVNSLLQESVAFLEVENHSAPIPQYLKFVIQIGYNSAFIKDNKNSCCPAKIIEEILNEDEKPTEPLGFTDCQGNLIPTNEIAYYRPRFDLKWEYDGLRRSPNFKRNFIPVRLSNNKLHHNLVCQLKDEVNYNHSYMKELTYSIIGDTSNGVFRFNFKEGQVAVAYLKTAIDWETGYPLIPDEISVKTAITYYVKWKIAEALSWEGREGFRFEAQDNERKWLKYVGQANSKAKMPKGIDGYQKLLEQSLYLVPRVNRYDNFFGKFSK